MGDVREASFVALGTAMKVVSEKNIMPFLGDVDNIKMTKVTPSNKQSLILGQEKNIVCFL